MAKGFKYGSASPLNFKVIAYASGSKLTADKPKANTIGVVTTTAITGWIFSKTEPSSPAAGNVWFRTDISSTTSFNAVRKNKLYVYPVECKQYVSGSWKKKVAKLYKSSAWTDWEMFLYKDGNINGDIVGGLNPYAYRPSTSTSAVDKPLVSMTASGITIAYEAIDYNGNAYAGTMMTTKAINFSGYKTLKIHVVSASVGTGPSNGYIRFGATETRENNYAVAVAKTICASNESISNKEFSIDISDLSGSYYCLINLYGSGEKSITFDKWWLEP